MSVELNSPAHEGPSQINVSNGSTIRRVSAPKKSLESRLWDLLQPLARLWGLITAVGKMFVPVKNNN